MKLKLILAILLLSAPLWAAEPVQLSRLNAAVVGAGVSAGGSGEFGYTTVGSSSGALGSGGGPIRCSGRGTPTNNGTVTKLSIYSANTAATNDVKVGLYTVSTDDLTTIIGTETAFTDTGTWSAGWKEFTVSYSVTAGTYYAICISAIDDTAVSVYYNETTGVNLWYTNHNYVDAWPSPIAEDATSATNASFKAYYTW